MGLNGHMYMSRYAHARGSRCVHELVRPGRVYGVGIPGGCTGWVIRGVLPSHRAPKGDLQTAKRAPEALQGAGVGGLGAADVRSGGTGPVPPSGARSVPCRALPVQDPQNAAPGQ